MITNKKISKNNQGKKKTKSNKPKGGGKLSRGIADMGSFLGGLSGIPGMAQIGHAVGSAIGEIPIIKGVGDYEVESNSIMKGTVQVPQFKNDGRSTYIDHREYIGDISGSSSFSISKFTVNAGNSTTFPWLANIASNYEQYEIEALVGVFVPLSGTAVGSTNTALGSVMFATQYDVNRPDFSTKTEMLNHEFSTSCVPWENMVHPFECALGERPTKVFYVSGTGNSLTEDLRFMDFANFYVATSGMQAANVVGELWLSYRVRLLKPAVVPGSYGTALWAHQRITSYTSTNILGPIIAANDGNMPLTISATGAGYDTLTFPSFVTTGHFLVNTSWRGSSTASLTITNTFTNCSATTMYADDTSTICQNNVSTFTQFIQCYVLTINQAGAKIVLSSPTLPTSGTFGDIMIAQIGDPLALSMVRFFDRSFEEETKEEEAFVDVVQQTPPTMVAGRALTQVRPCVRRTRGY